MTKPEAPAPWDARGTDVFDANGAWLFTVIRGDKQLAQRIAARIVAAINEVDQCQR